MSRIGIFIDPGSVYELLVAYCNAPSHPSDKANFIRIVRETHNDRCEYRFIGSLGFGGKFRITEGKMHVTCYPEDETPQRLAKIDKINAILECHHLHIIPDEELLRRSDS